MFYAKYTLMWMKYRNVLPEHKNCNMGSSVIHLHGACRHDRHEISKITIKTYLCMICNALQWDYFRLKHKDVHLESLSQMFV